MTIFRSAARSSRSSKNRGEISVGADEQIRYTNVMKMTPRMRALTYLYFAHFLFVLNYALPVYVASSLLEQFFPTAIIGMLYASGAALAILAVPAIPNILRCMGNFTAAVALIGMDIAITTALALASTPTLVALFFILDQALTVLILVAFDIFLERNSTDTVTGSLRAIMLTIGNFAILISPPITGLIVGEGNYGRAFLVSAALLIPVLLLLARGFSHFSDARYEHPPFARSLALLWSHKTLWNPFAANFLLQFFYSWMVIYTPLYLHSHLGFSWQTIGLIFAIMLSPFVLFELPVGRLADLFFGEREFMTLGFLIAGVTTMLIPFIHSAAAIVWALVLFGTRTGAALIEVTSTAYFYKHVTAADAELIGFFRNATSLAYIAGPIAASLALFVMPYEYLFFILGMLLIFGIRYSLTIADTK